VARQARRASRAAQHGLRRPVLLRVERFSAFPYIALHPGAWNAPQSRRQARGLFAWEASGRLAPPVCGGDRHGRWQGDGQIRHRVNLRPRSSAWSALYACGRFLIKTPDALP
jgi:hypothetical protein